MHEVNNGEQKPQNPLHQPDRPLQKHSKPADEAQLKVVHLPLHTNTSELRALAKKEAGAQDGR